MGAGIPGGGALGGGADPEALLAQIRALLDEYLAMGGDTPVAPEAQALAAAIDSAGGGAGGQPPPGGAVPPGPPPDMGGGPAPPDLGGLGGPPPTDMPIDNLAPQPGEPPRSTSPKSFGAARGSAEARLKKRNAKASK